MINQAAGSDIGTLSNSKLETEILVGEYLNGCIYPAEFIQLIQALANLPTIDFNTEPEFYGLIQDLKKELVKESTGLLNRDKVIATYKGKGNVKQIVDRLSKLSDVLHPIYEKMAFDDSFMQESKKIDQFENADADTIATLIDIYDFQPVDFHQEFLDKLNEMKVKSKGVLDLLNSELPPYYEDKEKVPKKLKDVPMYLIEQLNKIQNTDFPSDFVLTLSSALTILENGFNPNDLDPAKTDEFECLLECLRHPERFYYYVKSNQIVSPTIGQIVYNVYPETWNQTVDIIVDKYDNLPYNKALTMLNECALQSDDQELVTMCTQQYQKGT